MGQNALCGRKNGSGRSAGNVRYAQEQNKRMRDSMKKKRGDFGYIRAKKRNSLIKTGIMALLGIIVFIIGLLLNHMSNQNLFTVIAVLFVLPGAKSLVAFIVLFPYQTTSKELYEKACGKLAEGMTLYSDMVITSSEKVMHLELLAVGNGQVIGLAGRKNQDLSYLRKYLRDGVLNWGTDYKVKVVEGEKNFLADISGVKRLEVNQEEEEKVKSYLTSLIV